MNIVRNDFFAPLLFGLTTVWLTTVLPFDATAGSVEPLPESEYSTYQNCGNDADCVVVQNGCCDCANGGKDIAINRLHLEKFKSLFSCEQVMCTLMAAVPPCGSGVVSCVSKKCKYEAAKYQQEIIR